MTLLGGRDFGAQDTATAAKVVIVSAGLARRLWPDLKDPRESIGKQVRLDGPDNSPHEIIGIAGDTKNSQFVPLDSPGSPAIYRPFAQDYSARSSLVLRTNGAPEDLIPAVRREVAALDENLPTQELQPLSENVALALWSARAGAGLLGIFGALGLLVAAVGIYGVMSFAVAHRTREIGVRMALGAQRRDVLKLIVGQGIVLALIGIAVGLALALAVTRLLASQLYGLSATDPVTFVGVSIFLLGVAVVACYLPARRATKVDPLAALRHE
jgi:putative ABC transport system permease protein